MRASLCLREIGVETGGSNVQFAVNPKDGRLVVIEMNPRVSRSSALASKATGFPIAKVAAKLAVGYTLDEIQNDITGVTPASFEPTIDYVVTKIPRFAFEKFKGTEAAAVDRDEVGRRGDGDRPHFHESLQKALRGLETGLIGLDGVRELYGASRGRDRGGAGAADARTGCWSPPRRCARGCTVAEIHAITRYDPWFLERIAGDRRRGGGDLPRRPAARRRGAAAAEGDGLLRPPPRRAEPQIGQYRRRRGEDPGRARSGLLHDAVKAMIGATTEDEVRRAAPPARRPAGVQADRHLRRRVRGEDALHVLDLRGAELRRARGREPAVATARRSSSSAAGRTGSGRGSSSTIAASTPPMRSTEAGYETIMINCNPETVSTDYDTSDRLYFEPLTVEDVLEILHVEASRGTLHGVIVQFGGQTPLKLAAGARGRGHPDPRHLARRDRPRRGPRALRQAGRPARPQAAAERHRPQPRRGDQGRRADRLSGADPALLRARRAGDGDRRFARPSSTIISTPRSRSPATARC